MNAKMRVIRNVVVIVMFGMLGISFGCAKPPTKEISDAEAAVSAAKLAEADIYVPTEYRSAEDMLARARAQADQKEYSEAKDSAIQTIALAEDAREKAIVARREAKVKAGEIIEDLKAALEEAKKAEAMKYYAGNYNRLTGTLKEIESDYGYEKYWAVVSKGEAAIAAARELAASSRLKAADELRHKDDEKERLAATEKARRLAEEKARLKAIEDAQRKASLKPAFHLVNRGECLWVISEYEKVYDNPFQWPLIYKANRSQIRDPDLIFPGQDFKIPRDPSKGEITQAIYTAKNRGPWSLHDGR